MAKYARFWSLIIIVVLINLFRGDATTFTIENNCNYPVWPTIVNTSTTANDTGISYGFSLQSGESKIINTPQSWAGRIVGRTHCSTDSSTGNFSCLSGDCGTGNIDCKGQFSKSPVTLIEFSVGGLVLPDEDFYDVSLVNGYNLPLTIAPHGGSGDSCAVTGCVFNFDEGCPDDLRVVSNDSSIVACRSPCDAFKTSASCCSSPSDCKRNSFSLGSLIFKKTCPRAYSYALDDTTSTFNCHGSNVSYTVTFCPSATLARVVSQSLQDVQSSGSPSPSPSPLPSTTPAIDLPNDVPGSSSSTSHSRRKRTVLIVALSTSAVVSVLLLFGVWTCMRRRKIIQASNMEASEIKRAALDSLKFELNAIRAATNNFSTDNKLGEGGFGEVYKGVLENGQEIAVKRLSKNSGQGDVEFKTEVVLVAKLRHKNLVKLLGFCVAFEEKILVYEFLPKSSLDRLLFDSCQASLDWQTRFNIIVGIARGLLYLHEDSPLKVIHRDLKSSNILLDENLNPKIADFGLAKLFGVDQTQGDTRRIVGTYGYMAPEYAMTGHFSVKSDVYSFGVLVLEIVSGQRNRYFGRSELEEALLHRAWRLWNDDKTLDLVDTTLNDNFPREDVTKCIHIGLLCIQEDAVARPRMTSIVGALNGQVYNLPTPKPPNFFGIITNIEDNNEMQHALEGVYTGTRTITDLYPRD